MAKLLEAENGEKVPMPPRWLGNPIEIRRKFASGEIRASSLKFTVKGKDVASRLILNGVRLAGIRLHVERFIPGGPDSLCETCNHWGHYADRCSQPSIPRCAICAKQHHTRDDTCDLLVCTFPKGKVCKNMTVECPNCKGAHTAIDRKCTARCEAIEKAKQSHTDLKS